ncbi:hypothetical protein [Streptomyces sp. NPDC051704]
MSRPYRNAVALCTDCTIVPTEGPPSHPYLTPPGGPELDLASH